jgi:hypothetical protein
MYCGAPYHISNRVEMDEDRQTGTTQQENFKKKVAQDYKINHEF